MEQGKKYNRTDVCEIEVGKISNACYRYLFMD